MVLRSCPLRPRPPEQSTLPETFWGRRDWIKRFVVGSAVTLGSGGVRQTLLADISPGASPSNIIHLDLTQYPTLQTPLGSMNFNLFGDTVTNGVITVTRASASLFHVVSAWCTHSGCIVDPYDASPGTEAMICYCHGSTYDIMGRVISPAESSSQPDLPAYNSSLDGNTLRIEIPNLNFKVNTVSPSTPVSGNARFQISFSARAGAKYRILHTPDLSTSPSPVNFALTASGSLNQTQLNQFSTGTRNVWVQNTTNRGFYMVEMLVSPYP